MKKWLKVIGILTLVLLLLGIAAFLVFDKALPQGKQGPDAEALAEKMLNAIDHEAWDSTRLIRWSFPGGHAYTWDRQQGFCEVKWGTKRVLLNTMTQTGVAYRAGQRLSGAPAEKLLNSAWAFFTNDSYWLIAPFKIRDEGTERRIVRLKDGGQGLLVTYTSGGVTPGDSYLWKLDEAGLPLSYQLWVQILPIDGLTFFWSDWEELPTGARVASKRSSRFYAIEIGDIQSAQTYDGLGLKEDLFRELRKN